ncbi:hypothetical protein CGBL_0130240 [Corynebacterium glutamicum]|nr:hypothetical protein CGBL_0130240 [Corynebacterium glutamicum]
MKHPPMRSGMISFAANSAARETPSVTDVLGGLRLEVKPHRGKSSDTSSFFKPFTTDVFASLQQSL